MDAIRARRTLERVTKPRPDEKRRRLFKSSEWDLEEPEAFARIARSPVELALITGVVIRLFRAVVLTRSGVLFEHLWASMQRILIGFLAGSLLGMPIGLAMGSFRPVRKLLEPYTEFLRFVPSVGRRSSRCSRLLERWR